MEAHTSLTGAWLTGVGWLTGGMYWFIGLMGSGRPSLSLLSSEWVGSKTLLKQDHRRSEIYPGGGISQLTESGQGC